MRIENKAAVASYDYAPPQLSFPKPTPSTSTHSNNSNQNVASASSKKQNPRPARQKQKAYAAKKDQTQLQNARLISVKPIEIIEFEATMAVDEVTVKWTTKYEHMMPTFEIQRSTDGKEYSTFARIKGSGNTGRENLYKIVDDLRGVALGESPRYRLRHIAPNGEVLLLQAKNQVLENMEWNLHDKLETDPQTGQIQFKYKLENPANVSVKLVNGVKQEILKNDFKNNEAGNFLQSIDVSRIKKGEYLLIIEANQEVIQQYKVEKRI